MVKSLTRSKFHHPLHIRRQDQDAVILRRQLSIIPVLQPEVIAQQDGRQDGFDDVHGEEAARTGVGAVAEFEGVGPNHRFM